MASAVPTSRINLSGANTGRADGFTLGLGIDDDNFGRRRSSSVMPAAGITTDRRQSNGTAMDDSNRTNTATADPADKATAMISPKTSFPTGESSTAASSNDIVGNYNVGSDPSSSSSSRQPIRQDAYPAPLLTELQQVRAPPSYDPQSDQLRGADWKADDDIESSDVQLDVALNFINPSPFTASSSQRARVEAARRRLVAARDTLGSSSQEAVRSRRDFRRALARVDEAHIGGGGLGSDGGIMENEEEASDGVAAALDLGQGALARARPGASNASSTGSRGPGNEPDEIRTLLTQARKLSLKPLQQPLPNSSSVSQNDHDVLPGEEIKKARGISAGPGGSGIHTSASTPEGALGRIALPPVNTSSLLHDVHDDLDTDSILEVVTSPMVATGSPVATKMPDRFREVGSQNDQRHELVSFPPSTSANAADEEGSSDTEALRAGLRFVLACYDDLSKRAQDSKGLSNAIITSIAEGRTYQPIAKSNISKERGSEQDARELEAQGREAVASTSSVPASSNGIRSFAAQQQPRPRLRSGSILRALARGKTSSLLDGISSGGSGDDDDDRRQKFARWGSLSSSLRSPSRTTQMDFDASPGELSGPSTRLGMARIMTWQGTEVTQSNGLNGSAAVAPGSRGVRSGSGGGSEGGPERRRTLSNATSRSSSTWHRNSRVSQNEDGSNGSVTSGTTGSVAQMTAQESELAIMSATLKHTQREAQEAHEAKQRLMQEMEQLSEELFAQANEMVKKERIKSSALEKERDKLKLALSTAPPTATDASNATTVSSDEGRAGAAATTAPNMELDAQSESEAMMMAAVAQASRECAEAEEEAEEWRKHCEELEARIAILEEALYNSMAILAEQERPAKREEVGKALDESWSDGQVVAGLENGADYTVDDISTDVAEAAQHESIRSSSSVLPNKSFSDSVSSFYSAGEDEPAKTNTDALVMNRQSDGEDAATTQEKHAMVEEKNNVPAADMASADAAILDASPNDGVTARRRSMMHVDDEVADALSGAASKDVDDRDAAQPEDNAHDIVHSTNGTTGAATTSTHESNRLSVTQHGVNAASLPSPRSSTHSGQSPSRRASGVSSRRQSRAIVLPPRLPEPSSPLPSVPAEDQDPDLGKNEEQKVLRRVSVTPSALSNDITFDGEQDNDDNFHDVAETVPSSATSTLDPPSSLSSPLSPAPYQRQQNPRPNALNGALDDEWEPRKNSIPYVSAITSAPSTVVVPLKATPAIAENGITLNGTAKGVDAGSDTLRPPEARHAMERRHSLAHSSSGDSRRSGTSDGSGLIPRSHSTSQNLAALSPGLPSRLLGRRNIVRAIDSGEANTSTKKLINLGSPAAAALVEQEREADFDVGSNSNYDDGDGRITAEPSWQSVNVESTVVRRRNGAVSSMTNATSSNIGSAGVTDGQRRRARKSARSAILNHMPPMAPKGRSGGSSTADTGGGLSSAASITSGSATSTMEYGSFHSSASMDGSSLYDGQGGVEESPVIEASQTSPQQQRSSSFGRRRRFNGSHQQNLAAGVH